MDRLETAVGQTMPGADSKKEGRNNRRKIIIGVQIGLVIFIGVGLFLATRAIQNAPHGGIPNQIGDLQVAKSVSGEEALVEIGRLHGADMPVSSAHIANYVGKSGNVNLLVGGVHSPEHASQILQKMVDKIQNGQTEYKNLARITVDGQPVYSLDGPKGKNFMFQNANQVVWLEIVASSDPMTVLRDTLSNVG